MSGAMCVDCGKPLYSFVGEYDYAVPVPRSDVPQHCGCREALKFDLTKIIGLKYALTEVAKVMAEGDGREGRDPDDWKDKTEDYFTEKLLRHTVTHVQEGHHHIDTDSQCKTLAHIAALALYALENRMQLESTL